MKSEYLAYLKVLTGSQWLRDHPDFASNWWKAKIVGGMFRAGYRAGKKAARHD